MDLPLISIITVVYNASETLEQTMLSVLNQSYANKEYLIIDGGSTDGSVEIIKKYAPQLVYWTSEPDGGIFDAMNKGITRAKGEVIGILNADDWYEAEILNDVAQIYLDTGRNKLIHGIMRNFQNNEFYNITGNSIRRLRYDMIQHPTCFVPKKIYEAHGNFDVKFKHSADYDLIMRFVKSGVEFCFIEKVMVNFRLDGNSSRWQADIDMWKVRLKYRLVSRPEGWIRLALVPVKAMLKKILN
jgi:glycosyltransferase involved in cell wall biosynthesis